MLSKPISLTILLVTAAAVSSFAPSPRGLPLYYSSATTLGVGASYIPSGFTEEEWKLFRKQEACKQKKKNLGKLGPQGFTSRSMQSFQEAMESGHAEHQLPVFNFKQKVRKGQVKLEDVPYMQRGGSWDNSDVKGAKKKKWLKSDKKYAAGGYKQYQTVSFIGWPPANMEGLNWTGKQKE